MQEKLIACATKYGFRARTLGDNVLVFARNVDGCWVTWIKYNTKRNSVCCVGNTDHLNLWFSVTRSDLTSEKLIAFVAELNQILKLKGEEHFFIWELIDPEDWAEIANVIDAHADPRYTET